MKMKRRNLLGIIKWSKIFILWFRGGKYPLILRSGETGFPNIEKKFKSERDYDRITNEFKKVSSYTLHEENPIEKRILNQSCNHFNNRNTKIAK